MATKWAFPELEDFNDVASFIGKGKVSFETWTMCHTPRPMTCKFKSLLPPEVTPRCHFLVKVLSADNWKLVNTFDQSMLLLARYSSGVWPKHVTKIEPATKSAFEQGKAYYEKNNDFLTRKYNGEYIAIWNNEVLDHDTSFSSLAQRVYEKLGYVSLYMPFVTSKRRVLRFESPKYRRSRANAS